ncbi:MAG: SipW-dependent-type signal peptide-containing protein, partial [Clostridia bacterium]|nr:SipW-dependent-type signal peptide-containing protein [Clostridia bacterium]
MLLGTTYAWFTDSVTSTGNVIKSGNLDLKVFWTDDITDSDSWRDAEDRNAGAIFDYDRWEPGFTCVRYIKVVNNGDLAFKYFMNIIPDGEMGKLAEVIDVYYIDNYNVDQSGKLTSFGSMTKAGTLADVITKKVSNEGKVLPKDAENSGEVIFAIALNLPVSIGNEYQGTSVGDTFSIEFLATQYAKEEDSFGKDYDKNADYTVFTGDFVYSHDVQTANNVVQDETSAASENGEVTTKVNPGTKVKDGVSKLTVAVSTLEETSSNMEARENEVLIPVDVHVEGIADDNTVPVIVSLDKFFDPGLNLGNYELAHVENGATNVMTGVGSLAELDAHNEYYYDPATGSVTVALCTFSEVVAVRSIEGVWEGNFDYSWYTNAVAPVDGEAVTEYTIANADQLAAFGAIVGGMDGQTRDSFAGKTVKLIADINLGDKESENNPNIIFHPIVYWNNEGTYERKPADERTAAVSSGFYAFEGTFDGNGNTISNFYQNTWEIKGDHDWYDPIKEQYFRDGMGLFGKVLGGTVKNLTIDNFSSDGEITTTGVIAAYADSKDGQPAIFENIAITHCNPRVYNIGNGGIVGCAGWYSRNESLGNEGYTNAVTFRNITVDQTNKISALWGTYDVSCGGILGQYYPDSKCGIKLENCHVSAIIDVNNDVCANYQYYWYRYSGMFIGTIRANKTEGGYTVADATGIIATDCTYSYGSWNEYWYCELVKNSSASYTHDYQFGRLDNINDLSEIKSGDTWLKEGNFALVSKDRKSVECYHIFKDSNGNLYRHFHDVADESNPNIYEDFDLNGDGELNDLKEDRQRYYLPFGQVFNGLGYGVKTTY